MASTLRMPRIVPVCVWCSLARLVWLYGFVRLVWLGAVGRGVAGQAAKPDRPKLAHVEVAKALLRPIVRLVIPGGGADIQELSQCVVP